MRTTKNNFYKLKKGDDTTTLLYNGKDFIKYEFGLGKSKTSPLAIKAKTKTISGVDKDELSGSKVSLNVIDTSIEMVNILVSIFFQDYGDTKYNLEQVKSLLTFYCDNVNDVLNCESKANLLDLFREFKTNLKIIEKSVDKQK